MAPATTPPYAAGSRPAAEEAAAFPLGRAGDVWNGRLAMGAVRRHPVGRPGPTPPDTVRNRLRGGPAA
ncbi:hypothetical protein SAMN05428954_0951 [Streptomyces sp. 2112.3]|nr:hypothetical protein BX261_6278 [Streptomyces sp. 2321.6]SDQ92849.1 hypothetical protein SAMN05216511_0975 [Streptomyces sp. KS_16]SED76643.1 hypothetical protein SAMN05428954_0951 [Streptomyces sp. 2112.3]SED91327.1 hypothetical protein SAMN05428940_6304 [Streptomyces sp. 2133.1]SNC73085.1 hypothetical protein SAMN06272741_6204 [Streptomyces sp. 2114.4]